MTRRTLVACIVGGTLLAATYGTYVMLWSGVTFRRPRRLDDARLRAELCAVRHQPLPSEVTRGWRDPAPGHHYRGNSNGRFLALTRDARRSYHTVLVWDETLQALKAVVSVRESDPGSGASHDYRWSRDGESLLIYGSGSLPLAFHSGALAYAYVPDGDVLYQLAVCE